ncbi:pyridoxamine 5'-phosphate oxidase family protein [Gammaproteobacteria bacterium AS21]|jgi:putative heme iron utilization protein
MSEKYIDNEKYLNDCEALLNRFDSFMLSTVNNKGEPLASFAPFVERDGIFYIFVSLLAEHTMNMLDQRIASIMWIANEQESKNIYIRERAVVQVSIEQVSDQPVLANAVFELMEQRHGKTVNMLRTLSDFKLLQLTPQKGRFVQGFGKAFEWDVKLKKMTHISADTLKK